VVSALRPNSVADNVLRFLSILFLAVPGFWLVLALLAFLTVVFALTAWHQIQTTFGI
jgi:peptide/nickel transport system permease protein